MVRVDAKDLLPAFPTSILEGKVNVCECLVNLLVDFFVDDSVFRVPTTFV
jgi:hypothetical protein